MRTLGAAVAGAIAISFSAVFVRLADVAPVTAAVFRTGYALPVLFLLWWYRRRVDGRPRRLRGLAFVSGFALAADLVSWHASIHDVGVGIATLLANSQVVLVTLAAWALFRERPSRTALMSLPVVLGGIAMLSGLGRSDSYGTQPLLGVLLGVAAACFYAMFLLGFRRSNAVLAPAAGSLFDATAGAVAGSLLAGLLVPGLDLRPTWPAHGWLLSLALIGQVFGWLLIGYALPRLPALQTSFLILVQPCFAMVWGAVLFGERASPVQGAGVILVLAGIAAVVIPGARAHSAPA